MSHKSWESNRTSTWTDSLELLLADLEIPLHWRQFPQPNSIVYYVWGGVLIIIGVVGLLGNGIVLIVYTRFRRLQGPFSYFIINLATADFCCSILHFMAATSSLKERWLFGKIGCQFYAAGVGFFGLIDIITLSTIAVERYLVITAKPFSGSWKITANAAKTVNILVWVYCMLLVIPPIFGWSSYVPEGFLTTCSWDYFTRSFSNRAYYIYLLVCGFFIPVSVIIACYSFILSTILTHGNEMRTIKSKGNKDYGSFKGHYYPRRSSSNVTIRTTKIILMLVLLFIIAWTPYAVITMIAQFGNAALVTPVVSAIPGIFAKASVIYNPIIYGISHPHFRYGVRQYFGMNNSADTKTRTSCFFMRLSRRATASPVPSPTSFRHCGRYTICLTDAQDSRCHHRVGSQRKCLCSINHEGCIRKEGVAMEFKNDKSSLQLNSQSVIRQALCYLTELGCRVLV